MDSLHSWRSPWNNAVVASLHFSIGIVSISRNGEYDVVLWRFCFGLLDIGIVANLHEFAFDRFVVIARAARHRHVGVWNWGPVGHDRYEYKVFAHDYFMSCTPTIIHRGWYPYVNYHFHHSSKRSNLHDTWCFISSRLCVELRSHSGKWRGLRKQVLQWFVSQVSFTTKLVFVLGS